MNNNEKKNIVIIGGSFAGLSAAYKIKRETGDRHNITLIDKNSRFTFIPSLVWAPLGKRGIEDITFPLQPALESKGIEFLHASVERIDPERQVVELAGSDQTDGSPAARELHYDYLLVATGPHVDFAAVEGLGPYGGYTESICNAEHAEHAGKAWREFLKDPGPIIIGASQGAACYGAAYEFVFNVEYALRQAGLRDDVPITYITSEPFAGHFGIGGLKHSQGMTERFLRHTKINWVVDSVIEKVTPGEVHFKQGKLHSAAANNGAAKELSGQSLPFKYAMIIPPFLGVEAVRRSGLGNERGFIVVDDYFRHQKYPNIFAAGVSVAVAPPAPCPAGCSAPKTGYISEVMAKLAAQNIVASVEGKTLTPKPSEELDAKCLIDAGNQGIIMLTDRVYAPGKRKLQLMIPGHWAHWAKVAFEKYFIWKMRTGHVNLP